MNRSLLSMFAVAMSLTVVDGVASAADPTTGDCLAASETSLKLGNLHKLRADRAQLLVCAATTCPTDVRKECLSRVDEVNTQIPTIVFSANDASGADLGAVRVTMDGEVLAERLEGTALSVDPGEHTFTFEIAGQPPVLRKLLIVEAQKDRRELISFGKPPAGAAEASPPPAQPSGGLGTQKVLALVAGGVGVVGLGVGTALGLVAMSQKNDAQNACSGACATPDGVNKWSTASSTGNVSTIAFIVGGVGAVGAAVLWLTAPNASTPQVGLGVGGLQVKGVW